MVDIKELNEKAKAYALKNAVAHKGSCNQGAVLSSLFNEGLEKKDIKDYMKELMPIVAKVNSMDVDSQKDELAKVEGLLSHRVVREGLEELPNSESGVIMRMAPSPSGAMHVGHALTGSLSYLYVKKYGGKFYLRVEDTNPDNIYEPAYDLLKQDADWLFEGNYEFIIQSDRMELYYEYAKKFIDLGKAYVCECSGDDFRALSKEKRDCPCRSLSIDENVTRWEKMLSESGYKAGEVVLRFKSDMTHPNPAMRDFPLARINENEHPRQGHKFRVWPLMNLSVVTDDVEMGMTHIIRAKEHRDNALRQEMMFKAIGAKIPWTGFLGRWKFIGLELSASKITQGIKDGLFSGWDDPKLPTLQSLKNKGYKPSAFHKFAENRGISEVDKVIDAKEFFELLDGFNKEETKIKNS